MNIFKNQIIFITGGSGSWGNELTFQLLKFNPKQIIIYSRGEIAQVAMKRKFLNPKIKFIIGDIRDYAALKKATKNVDYIFHLAALKHVPICEEQPDEAIKTNIIGTQNLIDAAVENKVKKVIDVSTDKACSPLNLYGMTKSVGERLIQHAHQENTNIYFQVIRGGNALGSNGSVVPFFIDQIKRFNKIIITDTNMTRFFITLSEAINLLFISANSTYSGGLFVMKMPSCKIIDLAKILIKYYGNKDTKIEKIGAKQGEKIHEVLVSPYESPNCYEYTNKYYLIYPYNKLKLKKVKFIEYSSKDNLMNPKEIKNLLKRGGFIK
jgi:FlaA1/EpsC-like NDP-sugar epimerase